MQAAARQPLRPLIANAAAATTTTSSGFTGSGSIAAAAATAVRPAEPSSQRPPARRDKMRTQNVAMQQNAALAQSGLGPMSLTRRKAMLGGGSATTSAMPGGGSATTSAGAAGLGGGAAEGRAREAVPVVQRRQLVPPTTLHGQQRHALGDGKAARRGVLPRNHPHRFVSNHANRAGTRGFRAPEVRM
jgi:hypothetical protein